MRSLRDRERPMDARPAPDHVDILSEQGNDPVLTEAPVTVLDDEEEVFDLGFIIEDRDDRRDTLHASWQRLETLDTDEALESGRNGSLPQEADYLEREGVPHSEYPSDARLAHAAAERDEDEFASDNALVVDPYDVALADNLPRDTVDEDVDGDRMAEAVTIRGHAAGVVLGLGTSLPQDLGAGGFSVRDDPLSQPAPEMEFPSPPEEPDAENPRPDADDPEPLADPKPEMGVPQPIAQPEIGESVPPPKK